jgi:hypothetical protein
MKIIKATINSDLSSESLKDALYQMDELGESNMSPILMIPVRELLNANVIKHDMKKGPVTELHQLWARGIFIAANQEWEDSRWLLIGKEVIIENEGVK